MMIAFMSSARSRAGPPTRPSGWAGPSSQIQVSSRLISAASFAPIGRVEQVAEYLRGRVDLRLGRPGHRRGDEDQPGHPLRREQRGVQRQPAAGRRPDQPRRPVGELVEHGQEVIEVGERRRARLSPSVPPPVVGDHVGGGTEDLRGLPPAAQVGDPFVEQHEHRAVPGPALPVQFGPVQLQREGLAHVPHLCHSGRPGQTDIRPPLNPGGAGLHLPCLGQVRVRRRPASQ